MMYHEATACHVTGDLVELLSIFLSVLKATRPYLQRKGGAAAPGPGPGLTELEDKGKYMKYVEQTRGNFYF